MGNKTRNNKSGFTLAELLIVVAIIAVLIGIAIPVFSSQAEKSREATDLANVRTIYSEVAMAATLNDQNPALYNSADGTYKAQVKLTQKKDGWSMPETNLNIGGMKFGDSYWEGYPKADGTCTIMYTPSSDEMSVYWGGGDRQYLDNSAPYKNETLMDLKTMSNDQRVAADQQTLKSLGEAILAQHWTLDELKAKLGLPESTGTAFRIADYYQLKSGDFTSDYESEGFKLTSKKGGALEQLLNSIGYDNGGLIGSPSTEGDRTYTTFNKSLFYSDQLASNNFGYNGSYNINETKRSIIIDKIKCDSTGAITEFHIYTKAMDNQANLNQQDKDKFSFTIKL